jgi:hypothetical protein
VSDYPSSSPWGPHGPQTNPFSVTPNPTAPSAQPDYGTSFAPPAVTQFSGGGSTSDWAATQAGRTVVRRDPIFGWIRILAVGGLALGVLAGLGRAMAMHVPLAVGGVIVVRLGLAGAALGAGFPPAVRAFGVALRATLWIAITAACWGLAVAAAGQLGWLNRLR